MRLNENDNGISSSNLEVLVASKRRKGLLRLAICTYLLCAYLRRKSSYVWSTPEMDDLGRQASVLRSIAVWMQLRVARPAAGGHVG